VFIEVHRKKDGSVFLLNADAIEYVSEGIIAMRGDTIDPYYVRESLADLSLLLDARRYTPQHKSPPPGRPVRGLNVRV